MGNRNSNTFSNKISILILLISFAFFLSIHEHDAFGIEQQNSTNSTNQSKMQSYINATIQNATYFTINNATTPAVVMDENTGAIHAFYFRSDKTGGNLFLQTSNDGGLTFSEPVRVNDVEGNVSLDAQWSPPAVAVGPTSDIYATWYAADYSQPDKFPYGQVTMKFARSVDGGKTFEPAINPAPADPPGEQSYPFMTVSENGQLYLSYLNLDYSVNETNAGTHTVLRVVSSNDGGKTFEDSHIADKTACQCCSTVVAIGPDKEIYTSSRSVFTNDSVEVTNDTRTLYQTHDRDVAVIRDITVEHSVDNGSAKQFSEPSRVGRDDWFMTGCPDAGPGMAFDNNGKLHIAWFTGSETAPQGQGFYYTNSEDKGLTFRSPIPIHLLSEQWIPPTTQYLVTDSNDNAWITFVNSEGLKKAEDYEESFSYVGNGTVTLAVIDKDGNVLRNGPFAHGEITKHYPFTSSSRDTIAISWIDGDDVKLAFINTKKLT